LITGAKKSITCRLLSRKHYIVKKREKLAFCPISAYIYYIFAVLLVCFKSFAYYKRNSHCAGLRRVARVTAREWLATFVKKCYDDWVV
jgi:hypothetical protein